MTKSENLRREAPHHALQRPLVRLDDGRAGALQEEQQVVHGDGRPLLGAQGGRCETPHPVDARNAAAHSLGFSSRVLLLAQDACKDVGGGVASPADEVAEEVEVLLFCFVIVCMCACVLWWQKKNKTSTL